MLENIEKRYDEPLSKHSSFKIGGNAKVAYFPATKEEFIELLNVLQGERYFVVGNSSNLLFDDLGFDVNRWTYKNSTLTLIEGEDDEYSK